MTTFNNISRKRRLQQLCAPGAAMVVALLGTHGPGSTDCGNNGGEQMRLGRAGVSLVEADTSKTIAIYRVGNSSCQHAFFMTSRSLERPG
mmetsp:Transcript_27720/g.54414  ORF Transcript_27720/g.54414 Transcript_27720/m.54414 type:complete len:90 (+) Transcript_27720:398-667(+)